VDDADLQELPLREALIRWCHPLLVQRIQLVEEIVTAADSERWERPRLSSSSGNPRLWSLERYAGVRMHRGELKPAGVLFEAWKELEADFRRRVERGEINLIGVSTWPLRETERRPISNLWAADLRFDFRSNLINVVQYQYSTHRYVAVLARRQEPRPAAVAQPRAAPDETSEGGSPGTGSPKRGRPSFPLEMMVQLAAELCGSARPNHKAVAHLLREAFVERFPGAQPPSERTIIDHVPEIYARLGRQAGPLKP
jgi:hypothetical protein